MQCEETTDQHEDEKVERERWSSLVLSSIAGVFTLTVERLDTLWGNCWLLVFVNHLKYLLTWGWTWGGVNNLNKDFYQLTVWGVDTGLCCVVREPRCYRASPGDGYSGDLLPGTGLLSPADTSVQLPARGVQTSSSNQDSAGRKWPATTRRQRWNISWSGVTASYHSQPFI